MKDKSATGEQEHIVGTLLSALDIGRAGLMVAQVQLDVAGHNISNVNKVGFTRQRVDLTTRVPNYTTFGALGRGPAVEGVTRMREAFLDQVFRDQNPSLGNAELAATFFSRIEDIFQEPSDNGFANRLGRFFDALNDFSGNVEELPVRVALLSEGEAVASSLNEAAQRLDLLRTNANEEVRNLVPEINSISKRLAELNSNIRAIELGGIKANDLRDDRDVLLDDLSRIVKIKYNERDDGTIDVLLGGASLVRAERWRELEAVPDATIDPGRPDFLAVQFVDSGDNAIVLGGELKAAQDMRDVVLPDLEDRMDELALGLINAINQIHNQGNGLNNISTALQSTNAVSGLGTALSAAGLPATVSNGSFDILVYDNTNTLVETVTVPITAGTTTLTNIAAAIYGSANMTAATSANGILTITPNANRTFSFANDSSNALTALGINGFFTGRDAASIAVSQHLNDDPTLITSGYSTDVLETGDNTAALDMAAIRIANIFSSNSQTMDEFFESVIVDVGVNSRANQDTLAVEQSFIRDYSRRRQEVSGVNLDEEVTNLIMFQRAYEASARVISVADQMLQTLVNLVQ